MSGPSTQASDLSSPIPGAAAQQASAPPPPPMPMANSAGVSAPSNAGPMQAGTPAAAAPAGEEDLTNAQILEILQNAGGAAAPSTSSPEGTELNQIAGAILGKETAAQIASKFGKSPEAQRQIFQHQFGSRVETRVSNDKVQSRVKGTSAWKDVDPEALGSLGGFLTRVADWAPELMEGGIQGAFAVPAAAAGAVAGGAAGSVPGAIAGGAAGLAQGGAEGALAAFTAHEAVSRMLGADPDPNMARNLAIQTGLGAALPVIGSMIFRRPARAAADALIAKVESSPTAIAAKVGGLTDDFGTVYQNVTGRALPSAEFPGPTMGQAGHLAGTAVEGAEKQLGEQIGSVWSTAQKAYPDQVFPTQKFTSELENTLKSEGFRFQENPRITLDEPQTFKAVAPAGLKQTSDNPALFQRLASTWNDLSSSGGMKIDELRSQLGELQQGANYGTSAPGPAERTYRALYASLRQDRDGVLQQATKGTEAEPIFQKAFGDYADNIESLRALSKAAEKSPEKFAASTLRDAQTAQTAKQVLANPSDSGVEGVHGWDAIKQAYMNQHFDAARDAKTGIVDIPKFYAAISKNPDLANVVFGPEQLGQFKALASTMSKMSWQGLTANADTEGSGGVLRAVTKAVAAHGHPAYVANALGSMVAYSPAILQQIQDKGISKFAQDAATTQERSFYLRTARMLNWMMRSTTTSFDGKSRIPIESSMIPVLLNAGVRPITEDATTQQAYQQSGYQMYREKQIQNAKEMQQALEQAQAATAHAQQQIYLGKARGGHLHSR